MKLQERCAPLVGTLWEYSGCAPCWGDWTTVFIPADLLCTSILPDPCKTAFVVIRDIKRSVCVSIAQRSVSWVCADQGLCAMLEFSPSVRSEVPTFSFFGLWTERLLAAIKNRSIFLSHNAHMNHMNTVVSQWLYSHEGTMVTFMHD